MRRRNEGKPAGQLPGGESTVRPREPGLKALAAAQTARPAHRAPRPPGQVRPRPSERPRLRLRGFLLALPDRLSIPDPEGRGHGPEQPVGGRILARHAPVPRRLRTYQPWCLESGGTFQAFLRWALGECVRVRRGAVWLGGVRPSPASPGSKAGC